MIQTTELNKNLHKEPIISIKLFICKKYLNPYMITLNVSISK